MRTLLVLLFLAGCGGGDKDNHGYGFQYDIQGASGLKLRYSAMPANTQFYGLFADVTYYEQGFEKVKSCSGLTASPPFVIIVAPTSLNDGREIGGKYLSNPPLVLLDVTEGREATHEFVHYLLDINFGNLDPDHHSILFDKCV